MDRNIVFELGRICERAALACAPLIGRGDRHAADDAATKAMRRAFDDIGVRGVVVIGEGERDKAPMLYIGEEVGKRGAGHKLEIAVDPLEGTNLCANGLPGAITVIAAAIEGEGKLLNAPDVYMNKLAVGEACRGAIDIRKSVAENLKNISQRLKKPIEEIMVVVLDRPRHAQLIADIRNAGASIKLITDGDVEGALATTKIDSEVDCLMGIGGAPEGVIAAAGLKAMRGEIQGQLIFKNDNELKRAKEMGISNPNRIYTTEDLAQGNVMFAATGVTTGDFLRGVRYNGYRAFTNTVVMRSKTNTIRRQEVEHYLKNNAMNLKILKNTAERMVAPGKGILAIDESAPTIKKRFNAVGVEDSKENRRTYRELIITTPQLEKYISGVILFDETLRQKTTGGIPFPTILKNKGIIPGIKVDKGTRPLALHPNEKITEGLDGLRERLAEYIKFGVEFAKWRAVIAIGTNTPSLAAIKANTNVLARYAALCQEANIVPIVEPEVLIDGDYNIEENYKVTANVLKNLFSELKENDVYLEGTILKVNMVLSGKDAPEQAGVDEVAKATVRCLKENVPPELAGIVFLSGGQSDEKATAHLNAMNQLNEKLPWPLSFSYGRGIQNKALKIWAENKNNIAQAQEAILSRSKDNALASQGRYS